MTERSYERRRRAALPAALAALLFLVVVAGSDAPARWSGEQQSLAEMTIVLPPTVVASAPVEETLGEPPGDVLPFDDGDVAPDVAEQVPAETDDGPDEPGDDGSGQDDEPPEADEDDAIRHVFLIVLTQTDLVALADEASAAPYLAGELVPQGTLLTAYASAARGSLANGIALVSGQGPTQATLAECPTEAGAPPADVMPDEVGADGQQLGDGCVYPFPTDTVADQFAGAGLGWRAYVEDGGDSGCPVTPRNPFAFFHALLDTGECARHAGNLDRLDADLARGTRAPAPMYIVPGACHDGRPEPCAAGAPAGAGAADAFLEDVVPRILASAAWADGGLIVVTSDGPPEQPEPAPAPPPADTTPVPPPPTTPAPPPADPAAVAATTAGDLVPQPATYPNVGDAAAAGAARVGALLVGDTVGIGIRSDAPASHFALLRAISDLFALQPLGYAAEATTVDLVNSPLSSSER